MHKDTNIKCPNVEQRKTWYLFKNLHQAGIEPGRQASAIANDQALTIVPRPSL